MYITAFEIEDLRCFVGRHALSLDRGGGTYAGWTVLAGGNATGKTTLLQALALACMSGGEVVALAPDIEDDWARRDAGVGAVIVRLQEESRNLSFVSMTNGVDGRGQPPTLASAGVVLPIFASVPRGTVVVGFASLRLGPHRQQAREPSSNLRVAATEHLLTGGGPLHAAVGWLIDLHLRDLEGRPGHKELKGQVLDLLNDGLLPGGRVVKVDADGLWIERGGLTLPVRRLGDGYRAVAHLVLSLVQHLHAHHGALTWTRHADGHLACEQAAVVLIDEIDAHLHVSWQREIGFWLTRRFPNIQFLVTTHSPFVCQAASPRGLIRLPAPGEDRRIEHVSDDVFRSVVHGTVDDAVLTELFGLDHARSDRTEARLDEMAELEGRVLEGLATEQELGRYRSLRDELGDPLRAAVKRAADGAG